MSAIAAVRRIAGGPTRDPDHISLRRATRVTVVAVPLFVLLGWVLDLREAAGPSLFAVLALGSYADFVGPLRRRALRYTLTGVASLLMLPLGAAVSDSTVAGMLVTGIVVFATLFLGTLGGPFYAARFPLLLAFLFAATTAADNEALRDRVIGWTAGVVCITVAAIVLWPVPNRSPVGGLVAEICRWMRDAVRQRWLQPGAGSEPDVDALEELTRQLRSAAVNAHLHPGAVAADERRWAELAHATARLGAVYSTLFTAPPAPEDAALAQATVATLEGCIDALAPSSGRASALAAELESAIATHVAAARDRLDAARTRDEADAAATVGIDALEMRIVARQTCTVAYLVDELTGTVGADEVPSTIAMDDNPVTALRLQLSLRSLWFRNAVRGAVALMIAVAIVIAGAGIGHGFWLALGAFSVLRADLATTGRSARAVVVGTAIGFVISSGAVLLAEDGTWLLWVIFPVALFLACYGDRFRPEIGPAAFTTLLVTMYSLAAPAGLRTGEIRLIDVATGAALTLAVGALLWPRVGTVPRGVLADIVNRARARLHSAVDAAADGSRPAASTNPPVLALLTDLDAVLDTVAASAPGAVSDPLRVYIVATVELAVVMTLLLEGEYDEPWVGLGPEDRVPFRADDAVLSTALRSDAARTDAALEVMTNRLAGNGRRSVEPEPGTQLITLTIDRITDHSSAMPDNAFGVVRVGAGLALVGKLAAHAVTVLD